jgi:hypothetical protein
MGIRPHFAEMDLTTMAIATHAVRQTLVVVRRLRSGGGLREHGHRLAAAHRHRAGGTASAQ